MSENVYPKANEGGETAHVAPNPSFPDMEETVLDYWDKDDTFQKSVERNPSGDHSQNEFVFFDGPPFANGLPQDVRQAVCCRGLAGSGPWFRGREPLGCLPGAVGTAGNGALPGGALFL